MQYIKIRDAIAEQVNSGTLEAGSKLPSERKLADTFRTTRVTLREALSLLEADGIIYREDRRGWFISQRPLKYTPDSDPDQLTLCELSSRDGKIALLKHATLMADKSAALLLGLPPFSEVIKTEQILSLEGRPVARTVNIIMPERLTMIEDEQLNLPLKTLIASQCIPDVSLHSYRVCVASLDTDHAASLRSSVGSMALLIEKVYASPQHGKFAASKEMWRHDVIEVGTH
ncbi:phosphonate utilization transcriptional regulator PhnR [Veronia nyctiphanis]|uniref:Phosphonate utilization transcriptional regulator PhnR n=1 Tax=Veronia nyctiphanis TaxID=1278244 RepID=A0A4V1LT25_9GAMM|nr:GntR family transcriptional regulator [Veronia nyctiphanis]RXJ73718.1 phosphonate utilization transcriptional regulator PhnR [Veronia nyctiphanis]